MTLDQGPSASTGLKFRYLLSGIDTLEVCFYLRPRSVCLLDFEALLARREAIAACKKIVNDYLQTAYEPGISAVELTASFEMFGDEPWIKGATGVPFSSRDYAKQRSIEMCAAEKA